MSCARASAVLGWIRDPKVVIAGGARGPFEGEPAVECNFLKRFAALTFAGTPRPLIVICGVLDLAQVQAGRRMVKASYVDSCSSLLVPMRLFVL